MTPNLPARVAASGSKVLPAVATATAWGAIGTVLGGLLTVYLPQVAGFTTIPVAAVLGVSLSALSTLGLLGRYRRSPLRYLESDLLDADELFVRGLLSEKEYEELRTAIIRRHSE